MDISQKQMKTHRSLERNYEVHSMNCTDFSVILFIIKIMAHIINDFYTIHRSTWFWWIARS